MKIYAPVKDSNGVWASVRFVNGVGETNDPHLIQWFKSRGYTIENETSVVEQPVSHEEVLNALVEEVETQPDFDAMNPNELREWMKANGLGSQIKNIRNKEKLLEIIRG